MEDKQFVFTDTVDVFQYVYTIPTCIFVGLQFDILYVIFFSNIGRSRITEYNSIFSILSWLLLLYIQ